MKQLQWFLLSFFLVGLFITPQDGHAQGKHNNGLNLFEQNSDSSKVDSMTAGWQDVNAKIYFTTLNSKQHRHPDTSLSHFHYFAPIYPWWGVNLGHYGTAAHNIFFKALDRPGLSSGYHAFDLYKTPLDSIRFYNTTNPYSDFSFTLGSKGLQIVNLKHTQNITPNWNFGGNIHAGTSKGFFKGQKTRNIIGNITTNYASTNQRYHLKAAFLYQRFSQDENGGILSDSFLTNDNFNDRNRIPIRFPGLRQGADKSAVNNILRDLDFFAQNDYSWGQRDTTYNEDSTKRAISYTPRFRLQYDFHFHSEKHLYNDYAPDSARYGWLTPLVFDPRDTLEGRQKWTYIDNRFSLNGFLGKDEHLVAIQAGLGNRIDLFSTLSPDGFKNNNSFNTYLFGQILKEAFRKNQWYYEANAQLYLTGEAIGDFQINGQLKKDISNWAGFSLGFYQGLSHAPYIFEHFSSSFFNRNNAFQKMSTTKFHAGFYIPKARFRISGNYWFLTNYLYFDSNLLPQQDSRVQPVLQLKASKPITFSKFTLTSHVAFQQSQATTSTLHLPTFMIQEQLSFESDLFTGALHIATGIDAGYISPYYAEGYSPFINKFYLQKTYKTHNIPYVNAFFNFQLHHFRAFVSLSQIQQLLYSNNINVPGYPEENLIFRFGFSWILIN